MSQSHFDDHRFHIDFVCTGNICRSPMAEVIITDALEEAGLAGSIRVSSCGIGGWHVGQGADDRALAELRRAGYDGSELRASQLGPDDLAADALIALDTGHRSELIARGACENKVYLLRSFDPDSPDQASVADPYYGGSDGFTETRNQIEAARPGLVAWLNSQVAQLTTNPETSHDRA